MSLTDHAREAEKELNQKVVPAIVFQELSNVINSECPVKMRMFRDKFAYILDQTSLDVLDTKLSYIEAAEKKAWLDEQYMKEVTKLMRDSEVTNPLFATVYTNNHRLTEFLLSKGYNPNIEYCGDTLISRTIAMKNLELFKIVMKKYGAIISKSVIDIILAGDLYIIYYYF